MHGKLKKNILALWINNVVQVLWNVSLWYLCLLNFGRR
nr:MAG TPA: hypothetical protein [Caudoviricetes sp.]